uniref:PP12901 n=1 Tax=Homo sapiens TaxID=9606 RepID=Q71RC6_HUMAN|nr:PP12901 [Homo sapiens]
MLLQGHHFSIPYWGSQPLSFSPLGGAPSPPEHSRQPASPFVFGSWVRRNRATGRERRCFLLQARVVPSFLVLPFCLLSCYYFAVVTGKADGGLIATYHCHGAVTLPFL